MIQTSLKRVAAALAGLTAATGLMLAAAPPAHAIISTPHIYGIDRPEPTIVRIYTYYAASVSIVDFSKPIDQRFIANCTKSTGTYGPCLVALDAIGIHVPASLPRGKYTFTVTDVWGNSTSDYTYIDGPVPPPANTKLPLVSDPNPHVGETLNASPGQWTNAPTGYEYRWRKCKNNVCTRVEIAPSYVVQPADVGYRIEVRVFASNATGTASATSKRTNPVQA